MALDPVNHKALKGKFKDREDKDIDNDGDSDSSDEYLHKRRQAVSKAINKIKEETELSEDETASLQKKADKTGMPLGILRQVYNRGMAAWKTGHRPGTTPSQWGHARVNSFVTKSPGTWGKADSDLAAKVRSEGYADGEHDISEQGAGLWANIHAKRKRIEAGSGEKMRAPGSKGAPSSDSLKRAQSATESKTYRKPTQAEIDADRKKDEKGKPRPSISAKSVIRKTYGNMMGGLKNEEVEQIDEIQINWNHKTQKYHTIKHPDGSHWGVFDHSSYGTKGHEIRKIKDSDGNALKASDSRKSHSTGYKSGMGSPADAAKAWAKKHGGTIINHKIKEETEELDEISRDLARRYIRKVADKTNTGELSTKQVMKRRPGVNLAGKKAYPGIAGEPKVRATESTEFKTEAKDGDGANIVRDREFKEPKFKFKSHPYGSPEWHANKAAHEKFKAQQAAKAAKKAMKNEEVELDENIGGLFKNASEWESSAKARGLVVKSMTHPSGEATKYQIAKDKQGNNRGHFDHGTKSGRLKEEVEKNPTELPADKKPLRMKLVHFRHQE